MEKALQEKTIKWDERTLRLSYKSEYFEGMAHIEIRSEDQEPLPITSTGYKSHFFSTDNPPSMDETVQFVLDWLNKEAKTKQWQSYKAQSQQMELF